MSKYVQNVFIGNTPDNDPVYSRAYPSANPFSFELAILLSGHRARCFTQLCQKSLTS